MKNFRVFILLVILVCFVSQITFGNSGPNNDDTIVSNDLLKLKYEFSQFYKLNSLQESSQGEMSGKSPWVAFLLSMFLPTSGQIYNGDYTKALIQAGLMLGGGGLVTTMACVECGDYGTAQTGLLIAGAAMLFSGYIWSIVDAPMSANRINSELNLADKQRDKDQELNAFENSRFLHPNYNLISVKIKL